MVTRQQAWELHGLQTFVYRKGYRPFEDDGLVKLVVRCPHTFVRHETPWLTHDAADREFTIAVSKVVEARNNIPKPKPTPRFHNKHDYRSES